MIFSNITDIVIPEGNVTMIQDQGGNIIWQKSASGEIPEWYPRSAAVDWSQEYMQLLPLDNGTFTFNQTYYFYYSYDQENWFTDTSTVPVNKYQTLYIKQNDLYRVNMTISSDVDFYVRGSIAKSFTNLYSLANCFENNTHVIGAKYLIVDYFGTWRNGIFNNCFHNCTNLLTVAQLPATNLSIECYFKMFNGCTNLSGEIVLPATVLPSNCYAAMFENCVYLNYVKMLALTIDNSNSINYMLFGVHNSGIYVKNYDATWQNTASGGVPPGWTLLYYNTSDNNYYLSDKTTICDKYGNVI